MRIAVLGPDGSGRTTLAKSLAENHSDINYLYLGQDETKRHYRWGESLIKSKLFRKKRFNLIRLLLITINDWVEFRTARGSIKIIDQCAFDSFASDEGRPKKSYMLSKFLLLFYPRPDLILFLDGDPDLISRRNPTFNPENIASQIASYKEIIGNYGVDYRSIDTTKNSVEQSNKLALDHILND
jgi:thymidylate kinase